MVRRYEEPIEVREKPVEHSPGERPEAFVWRGRLYVVRSVLDHWQERRPWWRDAREGRDVLADARERQVWRVEASAGRHAGVGVYDLGATIADGDSSSPVPPVRARSGSRSGARQWQLLRVSD